MCQPQIEETKFLDVVSETRMQSECGFGHSEVVVEAVRFIIQIPGG